LKVEGLEFMVEGLWDRVEGIGSSVKGSVVRLEMFQVLRVRF